MPKRSAGCFTCRARKVRCDETKPECKTCIRRGTKCPGYRPTQAFILHTFDGPSERPGIIVEDESRYRYANDARDSESSRSDNKEGSSDGSKRGSIAVKSDPEAVELQVPQSVNPIPVNRVQLVDNFLALYLPIDRDKVRTPPSDLIYSLPSASSSRQILLAAIDAVSAAQLAAANKTLPLVYRSRSVYGGALTQLMRSLSRPDTPYQDETLLATYLLSLYEVFVGVTNGRGFFYHSQGMLRCLRTRGPASIKSRQSMLVLQALRYNSVSLGYTIRKGAYLDDPEWIRVTAAESKVEPWSALMDIVIAFPRILQDSDQLLHRKAPQEELEKVLFRSKLLEERARDWFTDLERNGPLYSEVDVETLTRFPQICDDRRFSMVFAFRSFAMSNTYILYWLSMLVIRMNSWRVSQEAYTMSRDELAGREQEMFSLAECICKTIPFSCQPQAGYTGRFITLTPLRVAREYFMSRGHVRESAWCSKAYYGAHVPGLYQTPVPITVSKEELRVAHTATRYV